MIFFIVIKYSPELQRRDSIESTCSEHEFRVKYQTITHRMVHRKSSLEMFRRLASKSFGIIILQRARVRIIHMFIITLKRLQIATSDY